MTYAPQSLPQPARRQGSTRGPKILTFIGIGVFALGLAGFALSIYVMFSTVPTGIMAATGAAESEIIATAEVPGQTTVDGAAGSSYTLWTVSKTSRPVQTTTANIEIRDEDGKEIHLRRLSASGTKTHQTYAADSLATFTTPTTGTYTVKVTRPPGDTNDESIFISPPNGLDSFFAGIFGSIGLMLVGIASLIIGGGLGIAGGIWWATTVSSRKKPQQGHPYQLI